MSKGKLGLFAGWGELPLEFLKSARERGQQVVTFALEGITNPLVAQLSTETVWIKPFKLGKFLSSLKEKGVGEIAFLGKIEHKRALSLRGLDFKAVKFLFSLKDRKPETIIRGIFREVESLGIRVIDPTPYLSHLLLEEGEVIGRPVDEELLGELQYGMKVARTLATLDAGQTVVVKGGAVVALEGLEGTDKCIERGAELGGRGFVVCKGARANQDMRVDVPTVGLRTINLIYSLGGRALAIDSKKTYLLNREEVEKFCIEQNFSVVGL
jgi:DUF1009 family protein